MEEIFKAGDLSLETFEVLMFDLGQLYPNEKNLSQRNNFELLKSNLEDIFGFYSENKFHNPKMNIKEISKEEFDKIIDSKETRHDDYFPYGRFWLKDDDVYIGVDNTRGEAFTEEFKSKKAVLNWL